MIRFHLGEIPETPNFDPTQDLKTGQPIWNRLREPTLWVMQLIATPIGLAAAGVVAWLWFTITPLQAFAFKVSAMTLFWLFFSIVLTVLVHELIHAAAHPKSDPNGISIIGFWPAKVVFYATYLGPVPRNRFLLTLLLPLAVISLLPLAGAALFQIESSWAAYISIVNVALASGDIFGAALVSWQLPSSATICNQRSQTYWRS